MLLEKTLEVSVSKFEELCKTDARMETLKAYISNEENGYRRSYNSYKDYVECEDFSMYRSTQNYENQQKMLFDGVGEYGIPQIEPTSYNPCEFISFNYAKSCKDNGEKKDPHTHKGYMHDEKGTYDVSPKERKMIDRVKKAWYYHNNRE